MNSEFRGANRLAKCYTSLWVEYVGLTMEHQALNLGQGFPDFPPPDYITKALADTVTGSNTLLNQYARSYGHPRLVTAIAKLFSKLHNRNLDPMQNILVTSGAYESLFCCFMSFLNPGDEAIIIEPYFDCYEPMTRIADGIPVFVPLRPRNPGTVMRSSDWKLDPAELESKFSSKTKLLVINTPNNPLGKVYTRDELEMIADLAKKYNVIVISDEVYEWLIYKDSIEEHLRIATLPGMWERTITVSSAGKTFSITGWKIGWSIGPEDLLKHVRALHSNCIYTCPTLLQEACAIGFELEMQRLGEQHSYFQELPALLQNKRDQLSEQLIEVGMLPVIPDGGYFMVADFSKLNVKIDDNESAEPKDCKFVKWMIRNKKLSTIPTSCFYSPDHKTVAENYIRFCFIKEEATLLKCRDILMEWKSTL